MDARETNALRLGLKAGEWVEVRSHEEILATLDARGRLEGMPFQPEMLAYCGRRLRVGKVAHKTCDTVRNTGSRRVPGAVHLEGVRCDGGAHGGCQARCLLFWKEAWLKRADRPGRPIAAAARPVCDEAALSAAATASRPDAADPVWVCQTTALPEMTRPLRWWDVRQYVDDVRTGNHSAGKILGIIAFATFRNLLRFRAARPHLIRVYDGFQKLRGGRPYPLADGTIPLNRPTPHETLGLMPGERVRVKSPEAIRATLNVQGRNRGMWFDQEMVRFCGRVCRVERRVERIIEEATGKMLVFKNPAIQLQGVTCQGECTADRLGCPRGTYPYWREIWLERA